MGRTNGQVLDARAPEASDGEAEATRRGVSRRHLIRNAGIVGAAAWTAPVIIDSVSSAALATTASGPCNKKYLKLVTGYSSAGASFDGCCSNEPSCNVNRDAGSTNLCDSGCHGPSGKNGPFGSVANSTSANYYKVTIPSTCFFAPSRFTNQWAVIGNDSGPGDTSCANLGSMATDSGPPGSGNGYFVLNGTVAYVLKTASASFVYLQYCCST
jgi:hypothetical protein